MPAQLHKRRGNLKPRPPLAVFGKGAVWGPVLRCTTKLPACMRHRTSAGARRGAVHQIRTQEQPNECGGQSERGVGSHPSHGSTSTAASTSASTPHPHPTWQQSVIVVQPSPAGQPSPDTTEWASCCGGPPGNVWHSCGGAVCLRETESRQACSRPRALGQGEERNGGGRRKRSSTRTPPSSPTPDVIGARCHTLHAQRPHAPGGAEPPAASKWQAAAGTTSPSQAPKQAGPCPHSAVINPDPGTRGLQSLGSPSHARSLLTAGHAGGHWSSAVAAGNARSSLSAHTIRQLLLCAYCA